MCPKFENSVCILKYQFFVLSSIFFSFEIAIRIHNSAVKKIECKYRARAENWVNQMLYVKSQHVALCTTNIFYIFVGIIKIKKFIFYGKFTQKNLVLFSKLDFGLARNNQNRSEELLGNWEVPWILVSGWEVHWVRTIQLLKNPGLTTPKTKFIFPMFSSETKYFEPTKTFEDLIVSSNT